MTETKASEESKSLFGTLAERIGHPVLGSFIFAFIIVNWPIFVTLLAGGSATDKIDAIRKLATEAGIGHLFWVPLAVAVAYFLLVPLLGERVVKAYIHRIETQGRNRRYRYTVQYEKTELNLFFKAAILARDARNELSQIRGAFSNDKPEIVLKNVRDQLQGLYDYMSANYAGVFHQTSPWRNAVSAELAKLENIIKPGGDKGTPLFSKTNSVFVQVDLRLQAIANQELPGIEALARPSIEKERRD